MPLGLSVLDTPEARLIVYGSLAPGGVNAFLLAGLVGEWYPCRIQGRMDAYLGFKSFRYDPQGPEHPAWLLDSADLPRIIPQPKEKRRPSRQHRHLAGPATLAGHYRRLAPVARRLTVPRALLLPNNFNLLDYDI